MAPSINEFEDLTQFADESFDTEEVDLFEFAEDDDSPLLRLKSIVLSLEWDITDDILIELSEELANLKALWKDDKVAQIYLQGMDNVGQYMRAEGAYAHPNAIKLLLTLYYNYEKIISSSSISGESITALLKADIRKFKVLQYQISAMRKARTDEQAPETVVVEEKKIIAATEPEKPTLKEEKSNIPEPLRSMEVTILGLEWEVTDEGLEKFHQEASELRQHLSGNTEAQVLVQGLQALGAYIREQTSNAHPDSFTILHSFYDALKMLLDSPNLAAEQRRQILVEQIGSLNSLKDVIAKSVATNNTAASPEAEKVVPTPAKKKPDTAKKAQVAQEETKSVSDDEMDIDGLFGQEDDEAEQLDIDDLENSPDALFSAPSQEKQAPATNKTSPKKTKIPDERDEEDEWSEDTLFGSATGGITPALADEDEEGGFSTGLEPSDLSEARTAEFDQKLDSFFNFGDEGGTGVSEKAASQEDTEKDKKLDKQAQLAPTLEEEDDGDDPLDSFFNFDDDDTPALEAEEAESLSLEDADEPSPARLSEKTSQVTGQAQPVSTLEEEDDEDDSLDSFFNFDDDDTPELKTEEVESLSLDDADELGSDDSLFEETPATEQSEPVAALTEEIDSLSMDDVDELGSDSFFEETPKPEGVGSVAALSDEGEDEGLDSFFNLDDDTPAPETEEIDSLSLDDVDELTSDDSLFEEDVAEPEKPGPVAALSDEGEDEGLDAFFNLDDDIPAPETEEVESLSLDDADELTSDDSLFEEDAAEPEKLETVATLSEEIEDEGFDSFFNLDDDIPAPEAEEVESLSLDDADELTSDDSLFEEDAAEPEKLETVATLSEEIEDEGFDSFFNLDDDIPAPEAEEVESLSLEDADELTSDSLFEETPATEQPEPIAALTEELDSLSLEDAEELTSDSLFEEEAEPEQPETVAALTEESEDEGLDSFFNLDDDTPALETEEVESLSLEDAEELTSDDSLFEETPEPEQPETVAALADEGEDEGFDSFFNLDDDTPALETEEVESLSLEDAEELTSDDRLFEEEAAEPEKLETVATLSEEIEDEGFDSFFNLDDDIPAPEAEEVESLSLEDDADELTSDDSLFEEEAAEPEQPETVAALADEGEDEGLDSFFNLDDDTPAPEAEEVESLSLEDADELASDDSFFEEDAPETVVSGESIGQEQATEINEKLDSLFDFDDEGLSGESQVLLTSLGDDEQKELSAEEDVFASIPEDSQKKEKSDEDFISSFEELDTSEDEENPPSEDDDVFVIAQGEEETLAAFEEEAEFDNLLDEESDDDVASVVSNLAETDDAMVSAFEEEAVDDVSFSDTTQESTATPDDDLILSKEYEAASQVFAEEPEGLFSQFDQDSIPDAFAGNEFVQKIIEKTEAVAEPESESSLFSSLALAAAALSTTSSAHDLQQVAELAAAAQKEESVPPNKNILLHLLGSSSAMLAKAPNSKAADNGKALVQELAAGLDSSEEPSKLSEIIGRYTAWQQDFFEQLLNGRSQASSADSELHQLQNEVTQLKQDVISEIRLLRQELGKG